MKLQQLILIAALMILPACQRCCQERGACALPMTEQPTTTPAPHTDAQAPAHEHTPGGCTTCKM